MKKSLMITSLLVCSIFIITGCGKNTDDNNYGVDLEADNVLACTSMKYNIFGNYSSDVIENHMFIAEYNDSKTEILNVKEVYTADYSESDKKPSDDELVELKDGFKTRFCDRRKQLITPDGYEGEEVSCDISNKNDVITVEMIYPKSAIEYASKKDKLGTLEEVKEKLENNELAWFYNNYFTCDKSYDKTNLITAEIKKTLTLKSNSTFDASWNLRSLANELNQQQRFYEEVFEEYKVDTNNRITLKPAKDEYTYENGDYTLTYNCVADSEETCDKVTDFVINSFIERAKDFEVTVTKK